MTSNVQLQLENLICDVYLISHKNNMACRGAHISTFNGCLKIVIFNAIIIFVSNF